MFEKQKELILPSVARLSLKSDTNNNGYKYRETTCRCLFGPPDTYEIREMCDKQEQIDRERLLERYGIDWETGLILIEQPANNHNRSVSSSVKHKSRKRSHDIPNRNIGNIENKYPTDNIIMKSVREIDMLQENIRQPFTVMTNRTNLLAQSVRKNLFPSAPSTSNNDRVNDENSTVHNRVPIRSSINKPYNKQLQITDFWRIRKSPPVTQKMDAKKVLTEIRKSSPTVSSRRKLHY